MAKENALESRWPDVLNIALVPAVARLSENSFPERRNMAVRTTLLRRIRSEFEEMPGLSLTLGQASKLFGIPPETCARILAQFAEEGLLCLTINRRYALRIQRP
jgi:hypothetical protein